MATIKIQCPCGQRYSFDVEPDVARMPSPVLCPVCGADGTGAADEILASNLVKLPVSPPIAIREHATPRLVREVQTHQSSPARVPLNDDAARELIEAKLNIKRAGSIAFILAAVSFVLGLLSLFGYSILDASPFTLLHAGVLGGLGYGTHRFSRACAVTMFLYYLTDHIYAWVVSGVAAGVIVFAVVLYFFGRGAQGAFTYHRLCKSKR